MDKSRLPPTAYEIIRVHPLAPAELISTSYWELAKKLRREKGEDADMEIHVLTRAYEAIADADRRKEYDAAIGFEGEPWSARRLPRKRFLLARLIRRRRDTWNVDPHEMLGLHPTALQATVPEAYRQMRILHLRLPFGHRRETLLKMLDDAYAVVGDPERRALLTRKAQVPETTEQIAGVNAPVTEDTASQEQSTLAPTTEGETAGDWPVATLTPALPEVEMMEIPAVEEEEATLPVPDVAAEEEMPRVPPEETPAPVSLEELPAPRTQEPTPAPPPAAIPTPAGPIAPAPVARANDAAVAGSRSRTVTILGSVGRILAAAAVLAWRAIVAVARSTKDVIGNASRALHDWYDRRVEARRQRHLAPDVDADDVFLGRLASTVGEARQEHEQSQSNRKTEEGK